MVKRSKGFVGWMRVLLVGALLAAPAGAQSSDARDAVDPADLARGDRFYEAGIAAFEVGDYPTALQNLTKAFELSRTHSSAAGLGQVELHLGQYRNAAEHLDFSLRNFPHTGSDLGKQRVMDGLAEARRHTYSVAVRVNVPGARLSVDGEPIGQAPFDHDIYLTPGERRFHVEAPGYQPFELELFGPAGGHKELVVELSKLPQPAAGPEDREVSSATWALIVGGAVTLVAAGTGTGLHLDSSADDERADEINAQLGRDGVSCRGAGPAACAALKEARQGAADGASLGNLSFGIAAVSLLVTVGVYAYYHVEEGHEDSAEGPASAVQARPRWSLLPSIDLAPSGAVSPSVSVSGSF